MATLPRASESKLSAQSPFKLFYQRPVSDFDAGINSSAAWTEHIHLASDGAIVRQEGSLSDEEPDPPGDDDDDEQEHRPARTLYDFEGKAEFRELTVQAGDAIEVVKEELQDEWSLVRNQAGEVGLLPRTYYTFTSDFNAAPEGIEGLPVTSHEERQDTASSDSVTPRGSPKATSAPLLPPLFPQNTGEWLRTFPSFRQSLLGGKSINRFSHFVTSGAEEFVLKGPPAAFEISQETALPRRSGHVKDRTDATIDEEEVQRLNRLGLGQSDLHFIEAGPTWKEKLPPFRVLVHSPAKRAAVLATPYTVYMVTSLFTSSPDSDSGEDAEPVETRITVERRFSHFVILHAALTKRLPGIALPPLPEKQYAGRFNEAFVEARRGDLERYINRVVRHPIARYAEILTLFLGCDSEEEWKKSLPHHLTMPPAGPAFYARVFHPAFNVDAEESEEAADKFQVHIKGVSKGVQGLRNVFGKIREARLEMSKAERLLSYSLLSLITSQPLATAPLTGINEEDEAYDTKSKGLRNNEGAWCWRDGCQDCLKLTKAMQKTSDTLQSVADLYDDHARRTQLETHESLKGMAHPSQLYEGVITTHNSTLVRHKEAAGRAKPDELINRCETVLNTTMAEMEIYHTQKQEDFNTMVTEHLDSEIAFYEQVVQKLKVARTQFSEPQFSALGDSPAPPSMYERELENPRLNPAPLPQPCPHVCDSAPMRPVSMAIQEGVSLFLRPTSPGGSVFRKLW